MHSAVLTRENKVRPFEKQFAFLLLFLCAINFCEGQHTKLWIDADTGNEMDDLYAIAYLQADTSLTITGLSSCHFNNPDLLVNTSWNGYPTKNINTVKISQQLTETCFGLH